MLSMLKKPITYLSAISLVSLAGLLTMIHKFEPCDGYSAANFCANLNTQIIAIFQVNLFIFSISLVSLLIYLFKILKYKNYYSALGSSLRQGILIAIFIQYILTSKILGIIENWNIGLMLLILMTVELIFKEKN